MKRRNHSRVHMNHANYMPLVCCGIFCGFFLGLWTRNFLVPSLVLDDRETDCGPSPDLADIMTDHIAPTILPTHYSEKPTGTSPKQLVLVGVMTAKKFLNSRVVAAYNTWTKTVPGRVIFFSCAGSEAAAVPGIPIIGLEGVDDTYPPQKKSFMMFKYMHDHYLNEFEFFMRADDDVYMRGDRLAEFLHSINSSKALYVGQAGQGNKEELGLLNLEGEENFCMGGPSMVVSGATLAKMVPHVSYCLKNLYTTHEDVEIGRCVHKFVGVFCTWAYEMQRLFLNNYKEPNGSFSHTPKKKKVPTATLR